MLGLETLDDNTDFFSVGLDSITLTLVHSHVCGLNCGAVDRDVIFKNPTVSELAEYLRRSREREEQQAEPSQPTLMESLFTKYSNLEYPTHVHVAEAATADPRGHSVVILPHPSVPNLRILRFVCHRLLLVPQALSGSTLSPNS